MNGFNSSWTSQLCVLCTFCTLSTANSMPLQALKNQGQFVYTLSLKCLFVLPPVLVLNTVKERGSIRSALWWIVDMLFWERGTQVELCAELMKVLQFVKKWYKQNHNFSHWQSMGKSNRFRWNMPYSFLTSSMASNRQVQPVCLLGFPFS